MLDLEHWKSLKKIKTLNFKALLIKSVIEVAKKIILNNINYLLIRLINFFQLEIFCVFLILFLVCAILKRIHYATLKEKIIFPF